MTRLDAAAQRTALERIAALVEEHYFDAATAARAAAAVRAVAPDAAGADPAELADRATAVLRPYDRHFGVQAGPWQWRQRREPVERTGPAMQASVDGEVGVLSVRAFDDADDERAAQVARNALAQVAECDAVVLDLCDVPGGWPSMVELLVGAFLGEEAAPVLTFVTREGSFESRTRPSTSPRELEVVPLVVAVDEGTASAAESCAYALQSLGRATIVGTATAGAANPGKPFDTGVGFSVFVSTGSPVDPRTRGNWEHVGVVPDAVAGDALEAAVALARSLS